MKKPVENMEDLNSICSAEHLELTHYLIDQGPSVHGHVGIVGEVVEDHHGPGGADVHGLLGVEEPCLGIGRALSDVSGDGCVLGEHVEYVRDLFDFVCHGNHLFSNPRILPGGPDVLNGKYDIYGNIMKEIDYRHNYIVVLDTETANTIVEEDGKLDMSSTLVYDCGFAVVDTKGNVYESYSFVVADIFIDERELMTSAYYANKIPNYWVDIWAKNRKIISFAELKMVLADIMKKYHTNVICAHNARFDVNALNAKDWSHTGIRKSRSGPDLRHYS